MGRPPYYRPPRSRPISFELPSPVGLGSDRSPGASVVCPKQPRRSVESVGRRERTELAPANKQFARTTAPSMQVIHSQRGLVNLASHNNVAQPFKRAQLVDDGRRRLHDDHDQQSASMTPKILVNDAPLVGYPTSTVHKSLLRSRRLHWDAGLSSAASSAKENSGSCCSSNSHPYGHQVEPSWSETSSPSWSCASTKEGARDARPKAGWSDEQDENDEEEEEEAAQVERACERQQQAHSLALPGRRGARERTGVMQPDSKRDQFLWHQQLERASIAHQNYRTLPIVVPKPKALHDVAVDNYMRFGQDPTFEVAQWRAHSGRLQRERERKIQAALLGETTQPVQRQLAESARVSR